MPARLATPVRIPLGLNFYEKSLRRVSTADAAQIRGKLPAGVEAVGVFVNSGPEEIAARRSFVRFNIAQLHGDEGPDFVSQVVRTVPVIKAFRVDTGFALSAFSAVSRCPRIFARRHAYRPIWWYWVNCGLGLGPARGGFPPYYFSGRPHPRKRRYAICLVRPYAVDVASGVESRPGKKDPRSFRSSSRKCAARKANWKRQRRNQNSA